MTTSTSQFFHLSPLCIARGRLEEAEQYFLLGNLDEALAAAQQAWREHPKEPDVFRVLAYLHMARGEYPPAEQAARVAVQYDEQNPASYATLAQVYLTFNVRQMAEQTLVVGRQHFPDDASLLVLSADLNFRLKRETDGVAQAKRALELNPHDGYAQALLGTYHLRWKQYGKAAEHLAGAVAAYPSRWDYLRDLGIAFLHERNYIQAAFTLTRAMQINSQDPTLQQYLCYALHFDESPTALSWHTSFFFYRHSGFGILLSILGYCAGSIGLVWALIMAITRSFDLSSLLWASFLLLGGIALVLITHSGVTMRGRKGGKFEHSLNKEIEKATSRWQGGVKGEG